MAPAVTAPQYRHHVLITPAEGGRWRVRLQALAGVCDEYVADGLGYWEAAQEVHEILAALAIYGDWQIAMWRSGGEPVPPRPTRR
jgi:hypothetical protein